jgi:chromate transporter
MEPRGESRAGDVTRAKSLLTLGHIFLRIGATAFGGLGAALALVERELVTKRQWLTTADVTEALTYTKLLPGSTVVQVVAYLGYKLGGWPDSAVATVAFVLPSALMMLVLAAAYVSVMAVPAVHPAINGLTAAVVGLLLATTYRLGKANISDRITLGIALASVVAGVVLGVSAAVIVAAAGLLGICLYTLPLRRQAAQGTRHDA